MYKEISNKKYIKKHEEFNASILSTQDSNYQKKKDSLASQKQQQQPQQQNYMVNSKYDKYDKYEDKAKRNYT